MTVVWASKGSQKFHLEQVRGSIGSKAAAVWIHCDRPKGSGCKVSLLKPNDLHLTNRTTQDVDTSCILRCFHQ